MESLQLCCAPEKCYALPLSVGLPRMVPADARRRRLCRQRGEKNARGPGGSSPPANPVKGRF